MLEIFARTFLIRLAELEDCQVQVPSCPHLPQVYWNRLHILTYLNIEVGKAVFLKNLVCFIHTRFSTVGQSLRVDRYSHFCFVIGDFKCPDVKFSSRRAGTRHRQAYLPKLPTSSTNCESCSAISATIIITVKAQWWSRGRQNRLNNRLKYASQACISFRRVWLHPEGTIRQ